MPPGCHFNVRSYELNIAKWTAEVKLEDGKRGRAFAKATIGYESGRERDHFCGAPNGGIGVAARHALRLRSDSGQFQRTAGEWNLLAQTTKSLRDLTRRGLFLDLNIDHNTAKVL